MKSIFLCSSSREFLRFYLDSLPRKGWGEIQKWADHLNVQSAYVSQVMSGHKQFNLEHAIRLAKYIGLQGADLDFFILLVEIERAGSLETREYFEKKIQIAKKESKTVFNRVAKDKVLSTEEQSIFYSSWIYSAIRLFCSMGSGKTLHQIAEHFEISKEACAGIVNFLLQSGLLIHKNDKYLLGAQKTHLEKSSPYVKRHWLNWHLQTLKRFDDLDDDEIVYSAPFSISKKDFEQLNEEIIIFVKSFLEKVQTTDPQEVAFLNIDLLRLK